MDYSANPRVLKETWSTREYGKSIGPLFVLILMHVIHLEMKVPYRGKFWQGETIRCKITKVFTLQLLVASKKAMEFANVYLAK